MGYSYTGDIKLFSYSKLPKGWMPCDGQLLAIREHMDLFAVIGNTYGGDGVTNFRLPDMRGRVPMGCDIVNNKPQNTGHTGGSNQFTLTMANMPKHIHEVMASGSGASAGTLKDNTIAAGVSPEYSPDDAKAAATLGAYTIGTTGAALPVNNMQPYLGLAFAICVQGWSPY